jgi:hypothetical protein
VASQAYNTFIKREVSAIALGMKREEELRGYSPLANPIHAWWNPILFVWHLPVSPISPRDLYMHYKEGTRRMAWENMTTYEKVEQVLGGGGGGILPTAWAQLKPYYTDEEGRTKMYTGGLRGGPRRDIVTCATCGAPMQRWGTCPRCAKRRGGRA